MKPVPRPRVHLFAGPSLSAADAERAFRQVGAEVTLAPPIEQGDILRLMQELPDVIGIIDGRFFHAPAVLHREILLALEAGARVLGAASIGALRAAELDAFGMEGIGTIYRWYRTGAIDSDDEVAVLHAGADDAFRPLTEALVSIRHRLGRARHRRIISPRTATIALRAMRALHFTRRTRHALLAAVPEGERSALAAFLDRHTVDLKQEDARLLVRTIAGRISGGARWPARTRLRTNQTSLFHQYRREYIGREIDGCHVPDEVVLALARLLSRSFRDLNRRVSRLCLAVDEAAERNLAPRSDAALLARLCRTRDLRSRTALQAWTERRGLSRGELIATLRERDLEEQVLESCRSAHSASPRRATLTSVANSVAARLGIPKRFLTRPLLIYPGVTWSDILIRELKFRGAFGVAVETARRILTHNATIVQRHPWLAGAPVRRRLLINFAAQRWRVTVGRVEGEMTARGFTGYDDFAEAARHAFVFERTSGDDYRSERLADCFHVPVDDGRQ